MTLSDENCMTCSREKKFDGEGRIVRGEWFCCWNCIEKAKKKGIITKEDI